MKRKLAALLAALMLFLLSAQALATSAPDDDPSGQIEITDPKDPKDPKDPDDPKDPKDPKDPEDPDDPAMPNSPPDPVETDH